MEHSKFMTKKLSEDEISVLARDSRIVAIRWDVIEWALVLDLDVPISETKNSQVYRAWFVFEGVSDITIPLIQTRIPTGFFLNSYMSIVQTANKFKEYSFSALLPTFNESDKPITPVVKQIMIKAIKIYGAASLKSTFTNEFGFVDRKSRTALASDDELLSCILKTTIG